MPDEQAGHEKTITSMCAALAGVNMIYGSGMLELGMTFSMEQLVIDNDIIRMERRLMEGVPVTDDTCAVDAIEEIGVGNDFIGHSTTLANQDLPSDPVIFDRHMLGDWRSAGRKDAVDVAHEIVVDILKNHVVAPIDADVLENLNAIAKKADEAYLERAAASEKAASTTTAKKVKKEAKIEYTTKDIDPAKQAEFEERAKNAVVKYNVKESKAVANEAIDAGANLIDIIRKGYTAGINEIGDQYDAKKIFLPQMMAAAGTMGAGMDILTPYIGSNSTEEGLGKFVICTVEGDIHSIGKDICAIMLKVAGFDVVNLGRDIPIGDIIQAASDEGAKALGTSALMTSTMVCQKTLEDLMVKKGLKGKILTNVGGAPVTQDWADEIGADVYSENSTDIVTKMVKAVKDMS